jgi:two-component system NarL family response regulator
MRIIIADDHAMFIEGLKNLLEARGHTVVATATDGFEAYNLAKEKKPDLMLIDINMPKCDGLEAAALINADYSDIKIIMLTASENSRDILNAIKAGACGYFLKSFESEKLFEAINGIEKGILPISSDVAGDILADFIKKPKSEQQELTERQIEVLSLIANGKSYKETAKELFISERTVRFHIESAIDKLHLKNREQLISYGVKSGMIDK